MTYVESLLGLSGYVTRQRAGQILDATRIIWRRTMGSGMADLESDLEACRKWFDPVAQGQRLRRQLSSLALLPEDFQDPGPPFTFSVGESKLLVTPEGRCVADLLSEALPTADGLIITEADLLSYDRRLAQLYRSWSRHRITTVISLLAGETKPLQIPAAGVILTILVNRSTSRDRALVRYPSGSAREVVDDAFFKVVDSFTRSLVKKPRAGRDPKLISGWMLYEARRRLGDDVLIIEGVPSDVEGRIWIEHNRQEKVLDVVTRDLARGNRAPVSTPQLIAAFDALVETFRTQSARLAGFGLAHERPANTRSIREALAERFEQISGSS